MKIREHCFEGEFEEMPMTIAKGHLAMESAIPSSEDAYKQKNKVEEVCVVVTKAAHLHQKVL